MTFTSLEDKIQSYGSAVKMLRSAPNHHYMIPFRREYSNWRDEQEAWAKTVVFFDQSFHMDDMYFKGPDVNRLFSDVAINDFSKFGKNKAKQVATVTPDGNYIGDAICFGFEDDTYSVVGPPMVTDWIEYHLKGGDYDVDITLDPRTEVNPQGRRVFRFQVQGPKALETIQRAAGGTMPNIKFFNMGEFQIAGVPVVALNHTMSGVPGLERTGLEIMGDYARHDEVSAAILQAGEEFAMLMGGSAAYPSTCLESGWVALPVPGIYSGESTKAYREYISGDHLLAQASLAGSYYSDDIEDYYYTPWDLGVGRLVNFNHDFIGRDALRAKVDEPHKKKVRLEWNDQDVLNTIGRSLFNADDTRTKYLDLPLSVYSTFNVNKVTSGDSVVGRSEYTGYLATARKFVSIALIDEEHAVDGAELTVVWGNHDNSNPIVETHTQCEIRATVDANAYL
jgi:glycine cleavage system aminomethyltransferase T